jgi:hypothetical protein
MAATNPTRKQLAARKKFTRMVKLRAKEARARKRAGLPPLRRKGMSRARIAKKRQVQTSARKRNTRQAAVMAGMPAATVALNATGGSMGFFDSDATAGSGRKRAGNPSPESRPSGHFVAGLPPRYQAIYESIKAQYLADGVPIETAKSYAAATARKIYQEGNGGASSRSAKNSTGVENVRSRRRKATASTRKAASSRTGTHKRVVRRSTAKRKRPSKLKRLAESFIPAPITVLTSNPRRKRNPSTRTAARISKSFHGRPSTWSTAAVSRHVKGNAAAGLGRLDHLKVRPNGSEAVKTFRFGSNAKLVATGNRHLAIAGERFKKPPRTSNPADLQDVGEVVEVQYRTDKPHLGFPRTTTFYHEHGEESGKCPRLLLDSEGYGLIRGGALKVTPEGIVD